MQKYFVSVQQIVNINAQFLYQEQNLKKKSLNAYILEN